MTGAAELAGVEPGDIILGVDGGGSRTVDELETAAKANEQEHRAADSAGIGAALRADLAYSVSSARSGARLLRETRQLCRSACTLRATGLSAFAMEEHYDPAAVEKAAQAYWEKHGTFEVKEDKGREKYYCLSMLPYPSGRLHMGHVRNYTIGDVLARFMRMQGRNVLQPMGWDAFGLPAENAAMSNGVPPAQVDAAEHRAHARAVAVAGIRHRLEPGGRHLRPGLLSLEPVALPADAGAAGSPIARRGVVNWDPVDQTVLANEQVIEGRGWRTGAPVEKREIPTYYLNITRYAQELLGDVEQLPGWPERVRLMQANWIGRSEGCEISFPTRPIRRTAMGSGGRAQGLHDARRHAVRRHLHGDRGGASGGHRGRRPQPEAGAFIEECRRGSVMEADVATQEKKGMRTGLHVLHPFTGKPHRDLGRQLRAHGVRRGRRHGRPGPR